MNWRVIAEGLARALDEVIPDGFEVHADAGGLILTEPSLPHAWVFVAVEDILSQAGGGERDYLEVVCWNVLSTAQDFIAEFTRQPWPGSGTEMHEPGVAVEEDGVHLWYGDRNSPVMELSSLAI